MEDALARQDEGPGDAGHARISFESGRLALGREQPEQRSSRRRRALLSALIVRTDFEGMIACRLDQLSEGGARLKASEWLMLPPEFWLISVQAGLAYSARTVWRRFPDAGVSLGEPIDLSTPASEAARRLRPFWAAVAR